MEDIVKDSRVVEPEYKRVLDYQTLYDVKKDIASINKEFSEFKTNLAVHFAKDEARDGLLHELVKEIKGNGKPGLVARVDKLFIYVAWICGVGAGITLIYTIATFIIPLLMHTAK